MSGPFRENIKKLVERLDGGVAAVLMGFDGISVDSFAKSGYDGALPDIQTLAMEFAHLIAQAQAGLTVDKKRRGSTIRFVFVPTPGDTRLVEIAPADITSHLVRRNPETAPKA